ncbi:MAG: ribbon-helix-helix protein, CopG family [Alphaproteobacteria bacterium]|nr:ribbon-helix-helix protein, CopG family [Alphaproteobacteria bacterium]
MPRATTVLSISLPRAMAAQLDRVRKAEHRTRSELVREALRHYVSAASTRAVRARAAALPEVEPEADEIAAVAAGRARVLRRGAGDDLARRAKP